MGKKKYSKTHTKVGTSGACTWQDHLFLSFKHCEKHEVESGTIKIRVVDKSILRNEVIGVYSFGIPYVFLQERHCIQHQWVALSNPEGFKYADVNGYVKLSLSVQGPGSDQVPLNEDPDAGQDKLDSKMILMPPQIKTTYYQINMRFYKAEKLPKMDSMGTIDGYVKLDYLGKTLKTKWIT